MTRPRYFLGADVGSTKTHVLIADEQGMALGFGVGGPGNHEAVGYPGLLEALRAALDQALAMSQITLNQIAGAGFGLSGYDWPSEEAPMQTALRSLGISAPLAAVNDSILGLLAGSTEGWGVGVVSGTGCNCWGWDRTRQRVGRVTGGGVMMGEGAGASEIMFQAVHAVARAWTRRGPTTTLSQAFVRFAGAQDPADLLEGVMNDRYSLDASAAPLIFQAAASGDAVAHGLVLWAGRELGELANAVIRQLEFEALEFEVILAGSMYDGSPLLAETMGQTIHTLAPGARLVRLTTPPVTGAVVLGLEQAGLRPDAATRQRLAATLQPLYRPRPVGQL